MLYIVFFNVKLYLYKKAKGNKISILQCINEANIIPNKNFDLEANNLILTVNKNDDNNLSPNKKEEEQSHLLSDEEELNKNVCILKEEDIDELNSIPNEEKVVKVKADKEYKVTVKSLADIPVKGSKLKTNLFRAKFFVEPENLANWFYYTVN